MVVFVFALCAAGVAAASQSSAQQRHQGAERIEGHRSSELLLAGGVATLWWRFKQRVVRVAAEGMQPEEPRPHARSGSQHCLMFGRAHLAQHTWQIGQLRARNAQRKFVPRQDLLVDLFQRAAEDSVVFRPHLDHQRHAASSDRVELPHAEAYAVLCQAELRAFDLVELERAGARPLPQVKVAPVGVPRKEALPHAKRVRVALRCGAMYLAHEVQQVLKRASALEHAAEPHGLSTALLSRCLQPRGDRQERRRPLQRRDDNILAGVV